MRKVWGIDIFGEMRFPRGKYTENQLFVLLQSADIEPQIIPNNVANN